MWLIAYAQHPDVRNELISVVSETMPHLKRGAMRDFLNIMQQHGYYQESSWNRSDFIYLFPNGNKIEFFSADMPSKVRGPRRDVLFINEANNVPYETFTQLEIRTKKIIWLDWNPVSEFWFYKDENNKPNIIARPDCDFITLTYLDNEALDQAIVKTIEARKGNKTWWKVYGKGELGEAEGRIYTGWEFIDGIPHEARLERAGLDFGYTNDPTSIVDIYYYNGGYIIDEVLYQKGLSNRQIADVLNGRELRPLVYADAAEPKSIDEIKLYGVPILPAKKGQGSILQGIQYIQDQKISVTKRSLNVIKEYRNYLWAKDKNTEQNLNKPIDAFNHSMDAIRYGFSVQIVKNQQEKEYIPQNDLTAYKDMF